MDIKKSPASYAEIATMVRKVVAEVFGRDLADDVHFDSEGADSLMLTDIQNRLNASMPIQKRAVSHEFWPQNDLTSSRYSCR